MNEWKTISIVLIFIVVVEGIIIFNQYIHVNLINNNSVTEPEYRSNPVIGNYSFIINSTTQFVKVCNNYTLIVAVVNINLTKAKVGDSLLTLSTNKHWKYCMWGPITATLTKIYESVIAKVYNPSRSLYYYEVTLI
jgi:hypothetical protein